MDNGNLKFAIVIRTLGYYEPCVLKAYHIDGHRVFIYKAFFRNIWILEGPESAAVEAKKKRLVLELTDTHFRLILPK